MVKPQDRVKIIDVFQRAGTQLSLLETFSRGFQESTQFTIYTDKASAPTYEDICSSRHLNTSQKSLN